MRSVLVLAAMILAITVTMKVVAAVSPRPRTPNAGLDGALTITAVSKGSLLPGARAAWSESAADVQIRLGTTVLGRGDRRSGVRLAVLRSDFELLRYGLFDVARDPGAAAELDGTLGEVRAGETVVLVHRGRLAAEAGGGSVGLGERLARIGATTEPLAHEPVSWALIAHRDRRGWTRLAEAVSKETGVVLTFTLDRDPVRSWRSAGEVVRAELEGAVEVRLDHELDTARSDALVRAVLSEPVGGVRLAGLELAPTSGAPASILWRDLPLGARPGFSCGVGMRDRDSDQVRRAEFSLWIDGELVESRTWGAEPGLRPRWLSWDVDLAAHAEKRVQLELRFEPGEGVERGLWALPRIVYGEARE